MIGIQMVKSTAASTQILIGLPRSFNAFLIFPLGPRFDLRKNNLLEITMRTGPRIHEFKVFLGHTSGELASFRQPMYRDGTFHTYLISLESIPPSWKGNVPEMALRWVGTRDVVEITKLEVRPMGFMDRVRYHWSQFWVPETLKLGSAHLLAGMVLLDQSFTLLLPFLFAGLLPLLYFMLRRGRREASWHRIGFLTLLILWIAYDLREAYNHIHILRSEFQYERETADRPLHPWLDDLYDFLGSVEKVVPLSSRVGFYSDLPLFVYARYFLYPRRVYERSPGADYIVIYQAPGVSFNDGRLMDKEKIIADRLNPVGRFEKDALILKKNDG
jgi:hypothetical protein